MLIYAHCACGIFVYVNMLSKSDPLIFLGLCETKACCSFSFVAIAIQWQHHYNCQWNLWAFYWLLSRFWWRFGSRSSTQRHWDWFFKTCALELPYRLCCMWLVNKLSTNSKNATKQWQWSNDTITFAKIKQKSSPTIDLDRRYPTALECIDVLKCFKCNECVSYEMSWM